jgi:hypothetical protein
MADYNYITSTGVIVPDTADVQAEVEQEYRDALGQSLIVTPNTPQGVLIAAEVTARMSVLRNNASLANQINPDIAGGVFLDALWRLTGGERREATRSVLSAVALTGQPGTLIPAGSTALTTGGQRFATATDVTLGVGGTAVVDFVAENYGPVPAPSGSLTSIESAVLGWETVNNGTAAVLGRNRETDAESRRRRRDTLALQGVALPEAIISALYATEGVQSLQFRENVTDAAAVIDGVNLVKHSIYVCVNGGTDADVAATLLAKKSLGCNWNGAVTVGVVDPVSGQTYNVKFDRPTPVPVLARVTVRAGGVADPVGAVQDALVSYVNGNLQGEAGFVVGGAVSPFELAGAVNRETPGLYVQKLEVAPASSGVWQTTELAVAINEIATLDAGGVTVIVL